MMSQFTHIKMHGTKVESTCSLCCGPFNFNPGKHYCSRDSHLLFRIGVIRSIRGLILEGDKIAVSRNKEPKETASLANDEEEGAVF